MRIITLAHMRIVYWAVQMYVHMWVIQLTRDRRGAGHYFSITLALPSIPLFMPESIAPDSQHANSPQPKRNGHKNREAHRAVAAALARGLPVKQALLDAGYSENSANKGRAKLPAPVFEEMAQHSKPLIDIGRKLTADDQENLARGRLAWNATVGKDDGYNSAKLLGQDRRVNMFVADQVAGLIVLQQSEKMPAPPKVLELPDAPVNRPKRLKP